jgi:hypothetical protein
LTVFGQKGGGESGYPGSPAAIALAIGLSGFIAEADTNGKNTEPA